MDIRKKKMRFRAWHRGFKEMDLIVGTFADRRLETLSAAELDQFEAILNEEDTPLYQWITGKAPMPAHLDTPVMAQLRDFAPLAETLKAGRSG